jgi:hypothetical protein
MKIFVIRMMYLAMKIYTVKIISSMKLTFRIISFQKILAAIYLHKM